MGLTTTFDCPVEDCNYSTSFRLGVGEEADPAAHAERIGWLLEEHPDHDGDEVVGQDDRLVSDR